MWQVQQVEGDRTRFASIMMRTPTETKVLAQQHRTLRVGNDEFTWHGGFEIEPLASLRIARRGEVYTMLARPKDSDRDRLVFQKSHAVGPVQLHCLLHTGATKKRSEILLKSIEICADKFLGLEELP